MLYRSNTETQTHYTGTSIGTVLTLIFLVFKICEVGPIASLNWFWIFSPVIFELALRILFVIIIRIIVKLRRKHH